MSFIRSFLVCRSMSTKYQLKKNIAFAHVSLGTRMFFSYAFAELVVYTYFCISLACKFPNCPWPAIYGLSIVVWWDFETWKTAVFTYAIGLLLWLGLSAGLFICFVFLKSNQKMRLKDQVALFFKASVFNLPLFMLTQLFYTIVQFDNCLSVTKQLYIN